MKDTFTTVPHKNNLQYYLICNKIYTYGARGSQLEAEICVATLETTISTQISFTLRTPADSLPPSSLS